MMNLLQAKTHSYVLKQS